MPRRAEWRRIPGEPTGGLGLLRQALRDAWALPHTQAALRGLLGMALVGLFFGVLMLALALSKAHLAYVLATWLALIGAGLGAIAFLKIRRLLGLAGGAVASFGLLAFAVGARTWPNEGLAVLGLAVLLLALRLRLAHDAADRLARPERGLGSGRGLSEPPLPQ